MRVVVLGATGQTGQQAVSQALQEGHTVTAVVRDPAKVKQADTNLKVVKGDVMSEASLSSIFIEQDAVVSCLGFPRKPQPVTGYTQSMTAISSAMRQAKVKRLVTMTSWWTDPSSAKDSGFFVNWVIIPLIRPLLTNMHQMEEYLKHQCQDIDYTVVRPPALASGPVTGKPVSVSEGYQVETGSSMVGRVNRSDVAGFMLSLLKTDTYTRKLIAITTQPKAS